MVDTMALLFSSLNPVTSISKRHRAYSAGGVRGLEMAFVNNKPNMSLLNTSSFYP